MKQHVDTLATNVRRWILPVLTVSVLTLAILTGYQMIRVSSLESGNREIICQSRALREQNPPETALERALLQMARTSKDDCDNR